MLFFHCYCYLLFTVRTISLELFVHLLCEINNNNNKLLAKDHVHIGSLNISYCVRNILNIFVYVIWTYKGINAD